MVSPSHSTTSTNFSAIELVRRSDSSLELNESLSVETSLNTSSVRFHDIGDATTPNTPHFPENMSMRAPTAGEANPLRGRGGDGISTVTTLKIAASSAIAVAMVGSAAGIGSAYLLSATNPPSKSAIKLFAGLGAGLGALLGPAIALQWISDYRPTSD